MKNNKVTQDNLDITWQDFSDHVTNLNSELVKNERFADVILVSDDLVEFKAQKVILSGCSQVVIDILKNDAEYIHLQRIKSTTGLRLIISSLYFGRISIFKDDRILRYHFGLKIVCAYDEMVGLPS